ncbi:hypothetical protein FJY68_06095 [candidate division WOR-3 bacterium]|uniref:T9SS type A sorting domain-containing protein n=1 Tax=candidate division WOR-3 bacterium TaxID=2052148 RepID=A0A938BR96_UNCW3|nr:hypothetical protein [candidate division WOR-3 bacterium]
MKRLGYIGLLGLTGFVAVASLFARTAPGAPKPSRLYDFKWYQANQWKLPITNYGTFGYAIGRAGGEWPAGSGDMYIYGAGIWIGCIKRTAAGKDTLVSNGYNPNSGKSEMTPGCYDNAPGGYGSRDFERCYIYPDDWPANRVLFPAALQESVETPLRLPQGDDTLKGYFHPIPQNPVSVADAWTVFSDRDPALHTAGKSPRPMGFEVYQTTYVWTLPWNRDIVFFKYDVKNRDTATLNDLYLGVACDADVGNATDDRCGLILHKHVFNKDRSDSAYADNLGYVYSEDAVPSGFVGFDFLQSPFRTWPDGTWREAADTMQFYPNGRDDNGNGLIDEPSEGVQVGMSAFKIFILSNDPTNDFAQYLALSGHDWDPPYDYNPFDSIDATPEDKRFLQATGPITLKPGEMTTVTIAMIGAEADRTGDPSTWPYGLALASQSAQAAYDNNWVMPGPPPAPNVTLIPGDGRATLVWDELPETAKDPFFPIAGVMNPHYILQDFQGYKVYRSRSGQPGDWQLLGQCDKSDGITWQDTTTVESLRTNASDAGLYHSFVDSSRLRLGFPYHYAVTAFDINFLSDTLIGGSHVPRETLSLESGLTPLRVTPRTEPGNLRPPRDSTYQVSGNPRIPLGIAPLALAPYAVREETYRIQFGSQLFDSATRRPLYRYWVTNSAGDTVQPETRFVVYIDSVTDTLRFMPTVFGNIITSIQRVVRAPGDTAVDTTYAWLPVIQMTMKLKLDQIPTQFFDRVKITTNTGAYPEESLALRDDAGNNRALWAYRGSDYRIVWKNRGATRTAEVYDLDNGLAVPYRYLKRMTEGDSADGWALQTLTDAADSIVLGQTRFFYVCGCRFAFRGGGAIQTLPADGDTWVVYGKVLTPAPILAAWDVSFAPMEYLPTMAKLDVKVVPNPYLVRNEWERHPDFRKLKFINLPSHCFIYIYNLAGDLVKTIEHHDTRPEAGSLPNQFGGDEDWDLLNESRQKPAPGVYLFHVKSDQGSQTGKFVLIY